MGVRKSVDETLIVPGPRSDWLQRCADALRSQKFKKVTVDEGLGQVRGDYKQIVGTLWGDITITLVPAGANTRLDIRGTANVDNVYALGRSPGGKLIQKFKNGLGDVGGVGDVVEVAANNDAPSVADELSRLVELHREGALDDEEFKRAKQKLLG